MDRLNDLRGRGITPEMPDRNGDDLRRYESLLEIMRQGVVYLDAEKRILSANPAAERITGLALDDVRGKTVGELPLDPSFGEQYATTIAFETGKPALNGLTRMTNRDTGRSRWVRVDAAPHFRPGEERPHGVFAVLEDVTECHEIAQRLKDERKRAEGQLRQAKARFQKLFDSNVIAILTANAQGDILEANGAFLDMIGYAQEDVAAGRVRWRDLTPLEYWPIEDEGLRELLRVGRFPAIEKEYIRRDGSRVPVLLGGVLLDAGTTETLCFAVDLTGRKRAEQELEASRNRLRSLAGRIERIREEERTRVAREIHDELGQMLTALKMDVQRMAQLHHGAEPSALKRIHAMAEHLDAGIGAVKRITAELRPAVLDHLGLAAAIEWQADDFQARTGIACSVKQAPESTGATPEQATAIFRIFQEALTNVARHAQASRVEIRLVEDPRRLSLEVTDNGKGIDPRKVMDPESLGLWGMRERAAALGGQVAIRRGPRRRGTILRVSIPSSGAPGERGPCES